MPNDPFYKSKLWLGLRASTLKRDRYTCTVKGCGARAVVVNHKKPRQQGGANELGNLESLCRTHDNQIKEDASGKRRSGGTPVVIGNDANGRPLDPNHPWARQATGAKG